MTTGASAHREAGLRYSRTQIGWWMLASVGLALLLVLAALGATPGVRARPGSAAVIVATVTIVLVATMIVFSTLSVRVTDEALVWRFGPGLLSWRIPLDEIASATPARLPLLAGLGIHWIGRGWVYNVSGRGAVEIVRRNGKVTYLGTDDPAGLAAAIAPRQSTLG